MLALDNVKWLVMDEADRLLENGFEQQVDEIIFACTSKRRRMALFSATMPERVEDLARSTTHCCKIGHALLLYYALLSCCNSAIL